MVINATWGLGEPLVSGKVNPDEVVIDAATRTVKRTTAGRKDLVLHATGGEANDGPADVLCLSDELISQLIDSGERLAEHFNEPQDIEWAWKDTLYLLQTRPLARVGQVSGLLKRQDACPSSEEAETFRQQELRRLESTPHVRRKIWVAKGMAEVLPCPTPLGWEVASRFMSGEEGYGLGQRYLGFDPAPGTILQRIAGHVYVDLDRESGLFFRHAPIGPCVREIQENPLRAVMPRQVFNWQKLRTGLLVRWPQLAVQVLTFLQKLRRRRRDFQSFFQEHFRRDFEQYMQVESSRDYAALSETALADLFQQRLDHFLTKTSPILTAGSILAAMSYRELEDLLIKRLGAEGVELAQQLTTGLRPNPTLDMLDGMGAVARGGKLEDEFVREFGHRCGKEFELAAPRWREDRDALRRQVEAVRLATSLPSDARDSRVSASRQLSSQSAAKSRLEGLQKQWGRISRELVRSRLDVVRRLFPLREQTKDLLIREYELLRAPLAVLDRRFDLSGGVFYLNSKEIRDCALGQDFTDLINQRRHQHTLAQQLTLPQVILGDELGQLRDGEQGVGDLRGLGVSPGIARGRVRIVRSADELSAVKSDEILVTQSLDPTWTLGYSQAAALIAERGATLSHGAIVAREFGIPAVVNVARCISRFQPGQVLEVDGSRGTVTLAH
jgi:pyruvate,water dikinase